VVAILSCKGATSSMRSTTPCANGARRSTGAAAPRQAVIHGFGSVLAAGARASVASAPGSQVGLARAARGSSALPRARRVALDCRAVLEKPTIQYSETSRAKSSSVLGAPGRGHTLCCLHSCNIRTARDRQSALGFSMRGTLHPYLYIKAVGTSHAGHVLPICLACTGQLRAARERLVRVPCVAWCPVSTFRMRSHMLCSV
jgi:hypothetical protein